MVLLSLADKKTESVALISIKECNGAKENKKVPADEAIEPIDMYRGLLKAKRSAHHEAVKHIVGISKSEKQYEMIQIIFDKLFSVTKESQVQLMSSGFIPGDDIPQNFTVREFLSTVLENTAFLSEIVLRFPDICGRLLNQKNEWLVLTKWAVNFSNATGIYDKPELMLMDLVSQELRFVEPRENYINPFKEDTIKLKEMQKKMEKDKKKKAREEKKKKRGPRLSKVDL
ncbi:DgyrCDS7777 [Dimorphilus gyrociliatus]|uniref:DgyrCDS7777 n=1 Tax=Dimorphilus gyrociliatus TaxID=2664684 RepID=A0A7I8VTW1_9ANNE|nr:DgyrCDS7777 [Dimorphilus gyrociliatus]